jgi:hypothetical protein
VQSQNYQSGAASKPGSKPATETGSSKGSSCSWGSQSSGSANRVPLPAVCADRAQVSEQHEMENATLWHAMLRTGPTQLDIMSFMLGILEGLLTMHASGLAHLDLKPGNVILTDATTAKLADFGAACAIDQRTGKLAVGRGAVRLGDVDSLVMSMENKLHGMVPGIGPSLGAGIAESGTSAAISTVQASMFLARSCPGEVQVLPEDAERSLSLAEMVKVVLPPPVGSDCGDEGTAVHFKSASRLSCSPRGTRTNQLPAVSGMQVYVRQPAYSFRAVPMVRCHQCCEPQA